MSVEEKEDNFTCVLLSRISLSLLRVKVKFGLAPFCFERYATACEQGQSAETYICELKYIEIKITGKGYCLSRGLRER